jgi:hypothetical protein
MKLMSILARLAALRVLWSPYMATVLRWCMVGLVCAFIAMSALPPVALAKPAEGPAERGAHAGSPPAVNRLRIGTLVEFDIRAGNVGEAMAFLLAPVHYRITHRSVDPRVSTAVLRRPIPAIASSAGVMSIEAALLLLIGEENRLVVDHVHRLIAVERIPAELSTASP